MTISSPVWSDGTLRPPAGAIITFTGEGRILRSQASTGAAFDVANGATFNNLRITGPNPCYWTFNLPGFPAAQQGQMYSQNIPSREPQHGIAVRGGTVVVNGADIRDVWGDAIYVDGGSGHRFNNVVGRCLGRSGISIVNGSDIVLSSGRFSGAYWWGLNVEPFNTRSVSGVRVENTAIGFSRAQWAFSGGPDFNCAVTNIDFSRVVLEPAAMRPAGIDACVSREFRLPQGS